MEENRIVHAIPCVDVGGRERELQVIGEPGRLTFVAPPGNVAHIHPRQHEALRHAIREALPVAWKATP